MPNRISKKDNRCKLPMRRLCDCLRAGKERNKQCNNYRKILKMCLQRSSHVFNSGP